MILKQWTLDQFLKWIGITVLTVNFVPVGLYLTHKASSATEKNLSERAESLAKTIAVQIVDSLLLEDYLALHDTLHKAASADTEIRYLCIENANGDIVAHTFDNGYPIALAELWANNYGSKILYFRTEDEQLLDISTPILTGQLGTLHIGMSRAKAVNAVGKLLWWMGIVLTGGMVVILIGSHLVAAKVSRPLHQLEAQVSQFSLLPDTSVTTNLSGIRELDSLSKCFCEMAHSLQELERERAATQQRMIHAERLAALGELAAGLAHEVHNPLDGMLECLRLLQDDPQESERAQKYHPMLKEGLERIDRVMQQTLTFAHSGQHITLQTCKITDMLETLEMLTQGHLQGRKVQLTWGDVNDSSCLCDKQGFEQAGLNLILNAADAAEENESPIVRVDVITDSQWIYLSVEDSGSGISEQLRERIFEPFFTTKPIGKGTGLGLSVSRQLIRAAGGDIQLSAEPSSLGGAKFVIKIPRA